MTICFMTVKRTVKFLAFVACIAVPSVGVTAQIIKLPVIVKKPVPTATPKPPSTVAQPKPTPKVESGPSAETIEQFQKDAKPYAQAISRLENYERVQEWSPRHPAGTLRETLAEAAALAEIIKQKYPNIENPSRCSVFDCKAGDWRRLAENRQQIVQTYVNKMFGFSLKKRAAELDKTRRDIKISQGFVLPRYFDDKVARIALNDDWKESFAAAGLQTPDDSALAEYNAAYDALIEAAKQEAPNWVFPAPYHDVMIEAKARGWFKDFEPKGTIVKIGTFHDAWEVTKTSSGLPNGRYKRGYILYKKPGVEQCITVGFSFEQNYMGGGRYNAMAVTSGMHQGGLRLQSCNK